MQKTAFQLIILPLLYAMQAEDCGECSGAGDTADFPTPTTGFNTGMKRRKGGYTGYALMKCTESFTLITDSVEWNAKIVSGDVLIRLNCGIKTGKTSEADSVEEGSCLVDEETRRKHTYTIEDHRDNAAFDTAELYKHLQANPDAYLIAFIKCDTTEITAFQRAHLNPNKNVDDTKAGKEIWNMVATYDSIQEVDVVKLPFKITSLTYT